MAQPNQLAALAEAPALDPVAEPLSQAIRDVYASAGEAGRQVKNAVHGVWLGHPLHPVLTDVPLGAWTTALALDALAVSTGDRSLSRAADVAIAVGLAGAAASAVTGLTDWSETSGRARREGLVHGLLNVAATTLYAAAYALRRKEKRQAGDVLALAGYAVAAGSAWLGGDLVYRGRIGVSHAEVDGPETFTDVAASADLPEGTMLRVNAEGTDVLLVRQHGQVCALSHACAHLGGPLSEGTLGEGTVECPWHGSVFSLEDGHVVNGPSVHDQPVFQVRERDGRVQVRGGR